MEVLVEYAGRHKLITAKDGQCVLVKSLAEFGLPIHEGVLAEIWNEEWNTWIVVGDVMEIKAKSKIRLNMATGGTAGRIEYISASPSTPASHTLHSATTVPVEFVLDKDVSRSSSNAPIDLALDRYAVREDAETMKPDDMRQAPPPTEAVSPVDNTPRVASSFGPSPAAVTPASERSRRRRATSSPWTAVLERVSMSCRSALQGHVPIPEGHWHELINCWYEVTTESSFYPDSGDYRKWATDLVDLFGSAVRGRPTLYESIDFVQAKMRMKMKNERYKSADRRLEEERAMKKVRHPKKKILESMGIPNYEPAKKADDPASVGAMLKLKNVPMPVEEREKLKADTFALRRSMVLSGTQLTEIKSKFPWLFEEGELWEEFHRICGEERRKQAEGKLELITAAVKQKVFTETEEDTVGALCSLFGAGCAMDRGGGLVVQNGVLLLHDDEICTISGGRIRQLLAWTAAHAVFAVKPAPSTKELVFFIQEVCLRVKERKRTSKASSVMQFLGLNAETED